MKGLYLSMLMLNIHLWHETNSYVGFTSTFEYIKLKILKCAHQSMGMYFVQFNMPDLLCPRLVLITGDTWLSTSLCKQTFRKIHCTYWPNYPQKLVCMLLYVINAVITELMRLLLMKPIVSFDVRNTEKNLCNTGKTQAISSQLECTLAIHEQKWEKDFQSW